MKGTETFNPAHPPLMHVSCNICGSSEQYIKRRINGYSIVKCRLCGLCYVNPAPDAQVIRTAYETLVGEPYNVFFGLNSSFDVVRKFNLQPSDEIMKFNQYLSQIEQTMERGSILDAGCAGGHFLSEAKKRGWQTAGVELGKSGNTASLSTLGIKLCTLEEAQFPNRSFDVVFARALIEHLPDPSEFLREVLRILKPGGLMVLAAIPNLNSFTIQLGVDKFIGNMPPAHLFYFTPRTASKLIRNSGFNIKHLRSWGISETITDLIKFPSLKANDNNHLPGFSFIKAGLNGIINFFKTGSVFDVFAHKNAA